MGVTDKGAFINHPHHAETSASFAAAVSQSRRVEGEKPSIQGQKRFPVIGGNAMKAPLDVHAMANNPQPSARRFPD
jgi:hypothetical protein